MTGKFTRRIAKELKQLDALQNNPEKAGIDYIYEPNESNMNKFNILIPISNFYNKDKKAQTQTYKNFKKAKIETITFEVNLEDDYPIKPPFIRIVKPILSGSVIFPSGNMCMDIFGSKVWSASISLINVLTMIINYLKSTGTIKVVSVNKEYNYEKSKKSHINVIKHCHSDWNHH